MALDLLGGQRQSVNEYAVTESHPRVPLEPFELVGNLSRHLIARGIEISEIEHNTRFPGPFDPLAELKGLSKRHTPLAFNDYTATSPPNCTLDLTRQGLFAPDFDVERLDRFVIDTNLL
jgi:hypothetical protein